LIRDWEIFPLSWEKIPPRELSPAAHRNSFGPPVAGLRRRSASGRRAQRGGTRRATRGQRMNLATASLTLADAEVLARPRAFSAPARSLGIQVDAADATLTALLLFLHARPCRAYTRAYLERKLGSACVATLDVLLCTGLVMRTASDPPTFAYGVEDPQLLAAVDELARRYHAVCALLGLLAALARGRVRPELGRISSDARVTKPKQRAPALPGERTPRTPRSRPRLRKLFCCLR
jgi:hypothetical protein